MSAHARAIQTDPIAGTAEAADRRPFRRYRLRRLRRLRRPRHLSRHTRRTSLNPLWRPYRTGTSAGLSPPEGRRRVRRGSVLPMHSDLARIYYLSSIDSHINIVVNEKCWPNISQWTRQVWHVPASPPYAEGQLTVDGPGNVENRTPVAPSLLIIRHMRTVPLVYRPTGVRQA